MNVNKFDHVTLGSVWKAPSGKLVKIITPAPALQDSAGDPVVFFQRIKDDGRPGRYGRVDGAKFLATFWRVLS